MGPLTGIKVVEVKGIGPGPYAGMLLADLGAEVVVVERSSRPSGIAIPTTHDLSSRSKKSIAIDIKQPEGLKLLMQLVASADVLIEGFRPGVAERLGFGPDECLKANPALVYGRITGWGQTGPLSQSAGHDLNYIAVCGALAAIGGKDKPVPPLNLIGDFAAGSLFLVTGILAALLEVQKSGEGQVIDAAITDGTAHLMSLFYTLKNIGQWTTERAANLLDGGRPYYDVYKTADDKFVAVACLEPQFFAVLIDKTGLQQQWKEKQNSTGDWPQLRLELTKTFKTRTREEWTLVFEGSDACVAPVLDYQEATQYLHHQERQTFIDVAGSTQPAPAPRFSKSSPQPPIASHAEGADTDEILRELGLSTDEIETLRQNGVLT